MVDEGSFPGRQGRLLFAYLVAEQGRPVPREELAEALWEEHPPATWEKALTVLVSKVRGLLAAQGIDGATALTGAFGCYRLELPDGSWVDVLAASAAVRDAEDALAATDLERARDEAALGESLTRQPFLPGSDGTWVEGKRRELAEIRVRALAVLADAGLRSGDAAGAAKWAAQSVELEPFRESGYRRLMEAHVAAGDRAEALRVYEQCRRLLAEELGTYPSPETESIYRGLLEAQPAHESPATEVRPSVEGESTAAPRARWLQDRRKVLGVAMAGTIGAAAIVTLALVGTGGNSESAAAASVGNEVGAIDSSSGHPSGSVPLAASPKAIAYGEGSVWAAVPDQHAVVRIDPRTHTVEQTIGVGRDPAGIAVGDGFVWVANSLDSTVSQIDPRSNGGQVVDTIPVGNGPSAIAYGRHGIWVANSVDRTVQRIDPVSGKPGRAITVDAGADAIAAGNRALWVTSRSADVLSRVDPRTGGVTPINVGAGPVAVAAMTGAVWVANGEDATVSRIDPAKNRVSLTTAVGEGPSGIAVAPDGSTVWVASELGGTLSKIDSASGRVDKPIKVGNLPQGVAVSAGDVFVAVRGMSAAHRGGTLRLVVAGSAPGGPALLDPGQGYTFWDLLAMTNDGLMSFARAGGADSSQIVPDLAVAAPAISDGGRTYSFRMRRGIRYSTGAPVRPADIRRGIERSLALSGRELPGSYLDGIVGASGCVSVPSRCDLSRGIVTDSRANTVVFHLASPDPDFLYKLALPIADAVPAATPLAARLPLAATGPYKIARYDVSRRGTIRRVRLVRNPLFRVWSVAGQPDGFPDQIVERFGYTGPSAVRAVQEGRADITDEGFAVVWSPALESRLRTRYSSRLHEYPFPNTVGVWLNTRRAPFDDVRVRRAVNYAVDRNHLVELAGGPDIARVGCQMLPPNSDGYRRYCPYTLHPNRSGSWVGPDLSRARRLVRASGTKGESVTVWFADIPIGHRNGNYLVSVLKNLGYRAHLALGEPGPGAQAGINSQIADFPSANNFVTPMFTCGGQFNVEAAKFCDPRIDAEAARARRLQITDPTAASRLWTKIDHEITDQAPWIVIRTSLGAELVSRRTGNYVNCYMAAFVGDTGSCLDQLWVR